MLQFVGYSRSKVVKFDPIEVMFEYVIHNVEFIEPELEEHYFRYRKKSNSLATPNGMKCIL